EGRSAGKEDIDGTAVAARRNLILSLCGRHRGSNAASGRTEALVAVSSPNSYFFLLPDSQSGLRFDVARSLQASVHRSAKAFVLRHCESALIARSYSVDGRPIHFVRSAIVTTRPSAGRWIGMMRFTSSFSRRMLSTRVSVNGLGGFGGVAVAGCGFQPSASTSTFSFGRCAISSPS